MSDLQSHIDLLPPKARQRYQNLVLYRDEALGAAQGLEKNRDSRYSEIDKNNLTLNQISKRKEKNKHPEILRIEQNNKKLTAEVETLSKRIEQLRLTWIPFAQAIENIAAWLNKIASDPHSGVKTNTIVDMDTKPPKDTSAHELRTKLAINQKKQSEAASAPYPADYIIELTINRIEALAKLGAPNTIEAINDGRPLSWHKGQHREDLPLGIQPSEASLAPIIWANKQTMIEAAIQDIKANADDKVALSKMDREALLSDLENEALLIERREVAVIFSIDDDVHIRADTDPRALLSVDLIENDYNALLEDQEAIA